MEDDKLYFIPKNIKIKKEIFKGFGVIEIIVMSISIVFGYLLSYLFKPFYVKLSMFCIFPFITFIMLMPLPNNKTIFLIFKKFFRYIYNQKIYRRS